MHTHHLDGFLPLKKVKEGCFSLEVLPVQWPGQPDSTVAVTITVSWVFSQEVIRGHTEEPKMEKLKKITFSPKTGQSQNIQQSSRIKH